MTPRLSGSTIHINIVVILQNLFIMLCLFSEGDQLKLPQHYPSLLLDPFFIALVVKGLNLERVSREFEREMNTSPHPGGNAKTCEELESVENWANCCLSRS